MRRLPGGPRRAAVIAAAIAVVVALAGIAAALASSEPRLAGSNDLRLFHGMELEGGETLCQGPELVPGDAARLRLLVGGTDGAGPPLGVRARDAGRTVTRGEVEGGYGDGHVVVSIEPVEDTIHLEQVCVRNRGERAVTLFGQTFPPESAAQIDGDPGDGRLRLEWLRHGSESWYELAPTVLHRYGLGKADWLGSWTLILAALLVIGSGAAALWLVLARVPRAARWCALIGMVNALAWSLLVPPFHVPDENAHFAYIQHLAETGDPPRHVARPGASDEQFQVEIALNEFDVTTRPENRPIWTEEQQQELERVLGSGLPGDTGGGASNSTNNPPLYHVLGVIAYGAGSWGDLLDRFALVRLVSVLLAGLTVLFTYGFLRELLPSTPWAWSVGALAVALQPLFGFMSGGVNNDALLFTTGAALLFGLARAFHRGLTPRRAAAIGAAFGLGLVAKATLLALAPGLLVAAIVLLRRASGRPGRIGVLRSVGVAAGVAAVPVLLYVFVNGVIWDRPLWSGGAQFAAGTSDAIGPDTSLREQLAYLWQWYLPRLPFMDEQFAGSYYPLWENSFKGFVGRFGWLDYGFPAWVYDVALAVVVALIALAGRELWLRRGALRARAGELASYATAVLGLVVVIALGGYSAKEQGLGFEQARYYLPLLPLYGAIVALGVRGAGRRAGPAVGAVLVVAALTLSVFAQLLTIERYYG